MRRILALIVLIGLTTSFGCSTEDQARWNDAKKDLAGENLKMKYFQTEEKNPFQ